MSKKGKVIEDLHLQFIWVKCVEDVNDHDNDHSDDGVNLNRGVVLCDPILIDWTIENFSSYLNEIYKILFQFSGKCSRTRKDFRHLLNSFKDIKSQGRQCFHPALLRYHPSILVRRELSNFANEVFLKIRHNSNFTKKIIGQLDIVFQKYRGYRPPMNFSQWHTHKVTPSIDAIITKLGKIETCPDFKNIEYDIFFLFVIVSTTVMAIRILSSKIFLQYIQIFFQCYSISSLRIGGWKDRPSTKVQAAPGSGSSLGYLFGNGRK
ncbi:hypothetical protein LIER_19562 [Lithospermum erythrorhizon]|uniref:Uncharacterized protein n=1 Tax=Lithospermum erythrorhizon TaxID=34254 RepID=A0AAV3QM01_LITER